MSTLETRLLNIEKEIKQAEIEVEVRKKQLAELKPKRVAFEEESKTSFGVTIQELDDFILAQEKEGEELIKKLEDELEKAKKVV